MFKVHSPHSNTAQRKEVQFYPFPVEFPSLPFPPFSLYPPTPLSEADSKGYIGVASHRHPMGNKNYDRGTAWKKHLGMG